MNRIYIEWYYMNSEKNPQPLVKALLNFLSSSVDIGSLTREEFESITIIIVKAEWCNSDICIRIFSIRDPETDPIITMLVHHLQTAIKDQIQFVRINKIFPFHQ